MPGLGIEARMMACQAAVLTTTLARLWAIVLVKLALMFSFQDGEHFTLPYHVLLDRTRKVRDELLSHRQRLTGSTMSVQPPGGATGSAAGSSVTPAGPSQHQRNDQEIFVSLLAIDKYELYALDLIIWRL